MTLNWSSGCRRLQREARDALELVLLPGLAALLPWRWGFAWLRWMAHWPALYRSDCALAVEAAQAHGMVTDARRWLRSHRLMRLVDHTDLYLSRTRSDRWLQRHVTAQGSWGVQGDEPALLVTFHWAAGMWAHRHARAAGLRPHMLLARPGGDGFAGRWVLGRYVQARAKTVALADGQPVIWVPGAMAQVQQAWAEGRQIIVVIDVPPDQVRDTTPQQVLGRGAHMPAALPRLAVEQKVPVTVFALGLDDKTGQRDLMLYPLGVWQDAAALGQKIFSLFDVTVQKRPAHWHFWPVAERFFAKPEAGARV